MSKTIDEMKKDIDRIQLEADLIAGLKRLMSKVGALKIRTEDHGWEMDGHTPSQYDSLEVISHRMMFLVSNHKGDANKGIEFIKELLEEDSE